MVSLFWLLTSTERARFRRRLTTRSGTAVLTAGAATLSCQFSGFTPSSARESRNDAAPYEIPRHPARLWADWIGGFQPDLWWYDG